MQALRRAASRQGGRGPPLVRLRAPLGDRGEVEVCNPRAEPRHLEPQLLGALGRRRLQRERPEALLHLRLDVTSPLDLDPDARQLQLGAVPAALELAEPGRLLDQCAPVFRLRGEHGVDFPLRDDRVHRAAEPDVGEQLDEIGAPHGRAVYEVLPLAAAREPPHDRDLAELEVGDPTVLVVEEQFDLARVDRLPVAAAREEHVVGLLGAELRRRQRAGCPDDRVGDVRLAGAVRPDDHGDAGLEQDLDRFRERLEAAQAERAQVHARSLPTTADDRRG